LFGPEPNSCPNPGDSGWFCTADIWPNDGDGHWDYSVDGDCVVSLADLARCLSNYGRTSGCTHEDCDVYPENHDGRWEDGVDGDGCVDLADLAQMLTQYGDDCN